MPSSDTTEPKKPITKPQNPPTEQEHLPCPRCDSTNTKFCYYNNYNFSQPRHFCKSCRRYWTHGGTLRDIPIGGGTRKSAKRSRTSATVLSPVTSTSNDHSIPLSSTPVLMPLTAAHGSVFGCDDVKGSVSVGLSGSFTSLLNTQGPGFLALGGFGLNVGHGFEEVGFGLGRSVWPFPGVVGDGGVSVGVGSNGGGGGNGIGNTWQFESGESGFGGGDCFPWPDLAISTPGSGLN